VAHRLSANGFRIGDQQMYLAKEYCIEVEF
jgi:hypothetical protein